MFNCFKFTRIKRIFDPSGKIKSEEVETNDKSAKDIDTKSFDNVFKKMDEAFDEMSKAFDKMFK